MFVTFVLVCMGFFSVLYFAVYVPIFWFAFIGFENVVKL